MKNINQELLNHVILHKDRIPHYHKDFPIILFWSHRSGCTALANWFFFQIGLFTEAKKYNDFIHYYEFWVYKNNTNYIPELQNGLLEGKKDVCKLVRNPIQGLSAHFYYLLTTHMLALNGKVSVIIFIMTNIVIKEYHLNNFYITFRHSAPIL